MKRFHAKAALAGLCGSALVASTGPLRAENVVYCYDPSRELIQQTADFDCRHRIISRAQAAAIRTKRTEYVRRAIAIEPAPRPFGTGSGFVVTRQGHVVTNRHVGASCGQVTVLACDGKTHRARLISASSAHDLALLQTDSRQAEVATFARDLPKVGSSVTVVGFPSRLRPRRALLVVDGLFHGQRPSGTGTDILSIGVRVSGGSSGSPVLDDMGRVIGVVFAKLDTTKRIHRPGHPAHSANGDIALAASADNLADFLSRNGVQITRNAPPKGRAESIAVRVNCLE